MKSITNRPAQWNVLVFMFLFCLALFPTSALAHTGLEKSTPEDKQVVEEVKEIILEFNTKVEKTSSVHVKNEKGEVVELSNMKFEGKVIKGEITKPLDDGSYTVTWKIIGADGHPVEGAFSFVVKKPVTEKPSAPNNSNQTEQPPVANHPHTKYPAQGNNIMIWGIAAVAVVALVSLLWMIRKKGN
jgi:methionine-rich copper-binding protein CopC